MRTAMPASARDLWARLRARRAAAAADATVMPANAAQIEATVRECRRLVSRRAMLAAGVAMVPIPGLDWLTDVAVLMKLIPRINRHFGLSPEQVARLSPDRRIAVFKAATAGGSLLIGRMVTRELVMKALRLIGVRLTAQQASKYVPIAGQAVSAALTYSALRYVLEQHIRQCAEVSHQLLLLPAPPVDAAP